ncbi:hypothetical protein H4R19_002628 [Coemansia spiralis]|nr:hypothetical protein H4R19_002628 [Coemansia spiralis]
MAPADIRRTYYLDLPLGPDGNAHIRVVSMVVERFSLRPRAASVPVHKLRHGCRHHRHHGHHDQGDGQPLLVSAAYEAPVSAPKIHAIHAQPAATSDALTDVVCLSLSLVLCLCILLTGYKIGALVRTRGTAQERASGLKGVSASRRAPAAYGESETISLMAALEEDPEKPAASA